MLTQPDDFDLHPTVLPVYDGAAEALADHPDEVTDDEAAEGLDVYRTVDDLDDHSTGLS